MYIILLSPCLVYLSGYLYGAGSHRGRLRAYFKPLKTGELRRKVFIA